MSTLKADLLTDYDHSVPLGGSEAYQLLTTEDLTPQTSALTEQAYQHALYTPISDATIRNLYHLLVLRIHTDQETPYRFWVYFSPDGTLVDLAPWAEESAAPPSPLENMGPLLTTALYRYGSAYEITPWPHYANIMDALPTQLRTWIHSLAPDPATPAPISP